MTKKAFEGTNIGTELQLIETFRYQATQKPDISEIQSTLSVAHYHFPEIIFNSDYGAIMASYFMFKGHPDFDTVSPFAYGYEGIIDYRGQLLNLLSWLEAQV